MKTRPACTEANEKQTTSSQRINIRWYDCLTPHTQIFAKHEWTLMQSNAKNAYQDFNLDDILEDGTILAHGFKLDEGRVDKTGNEALCNNSDAVDICRLT